MSGFLTSSLSRIWLPLALLAMVGFVYACSAAPSSTEQTGAAAPAPTQAVVAPEAGPSTETPVAVPGIPEERVLTVEWPGAIRTGDSNVVRLTLEVDEQGNIMPTAQVSGNQVRSQGVQIPNVYETHQVMAEARLDMAGVTISPAGEISEPMQPGETVTFLWSVYPESIGTHRGTIWVHLRFIPKAGGQELRKVLSAQEIEIQAVNLLGLGGAPARVLGAVGIVIGSLLGLDNVISWLWKLITGRRGGGA